ncbi:hypothetical protein BC835DRAFT_516999 [Cytidiella melzeri]|nr:hypothetical protein BC835DRAFT_516999 [Cytidiella melzeri]
MASTVNPTLAPSNADGNVTSQSLGPTREVVAKEDLSSLKASPDPPPVHRDTPSDFIPGLYTLGATYDVLNGRYADSRSTIQQVIDWNACSLNFLPSSCIILIPVPADVRIQAFGGKNYSIPEVVNFNLNTTSDYRSSYGKTTTEYTKSLSYQAGFEASFPGFSASASADYSESQRENLSHAFTRVTFSVTHYNLSLPPISQVRSLLKPWFVSDLDTMDPIEFYKEYGTHLLRSLTVGGRALFLTATDTRSYSSDMSLEAAAKISASYLVVSGSMELSTKQKEAMESFNESSETAVVTKGGDPRYGNEEFLKNVEAWAGSILDYPEFVDFGSLPCFTGLWEFASTPERRTALQQAYTQFVMLYAQDLTVPGPFLRARLTQDVNDSQDAFVKLDGGGIVTYTFPRNRSDGWYYITPGLLAGSAVIVTELVPGALAPVKWQLMYITPGRDSLSSGIPLQPPASLAGHFRAVHRSALTAAATGVTWYPSYSYEDCKFFSIDNRYWFADTQFPLKEDCFMLDPKGVVQEGDGWLWTWTSESISSRSTKT